MYQPTSPFALKLIKRSSWAVTLKIDQAWKLFTEGRAMELLDQSVGNSYNESEVLRSIAVGLLCVQRSPKDRPSMSKVVLMLESDNELLLPKEPGFFNKRIQWKKVHWATTTLPTMYLQWHYHLLDSGFLEWFWWVSRYLTCRASAKNFCGILLHASLVASAVVLFRALQIFLHDSLSFSCYRSLPTLWRSFPVFWMI